MEGGGGPVGVGGAFPPEEGAADGGESEGAGKTSVAESSETAVKAIGGKALGGAKAVGHALHQSEVPQGVDDGFSVQGSAMKLEKTLVKDVKALSSKFKACCFGIELFVWLARPRSSPRPEASKSS